MTYRSSPEQYAPPHRRPVKPEDKTDRVLKNAFPDNVHALVPRADAPLNQKGAVDARNDGSAENLGALVQRVAGSSMDEIDRVISQLETLREILRNEGQRVGRELAGYAGLSHSARTIMKVIGDSIGRWKETGNAPPRS